MNENREPPEKNKLSVSKKALIFEGTGILAFFFAWLTLDLFFHMFFIFVFCLSCLWVVVSAIIGIILGISGLSLKEKTKSDLTCSIIAITFPTLTVFLTIIFFSTGVFVIRFM